MKKGVFALGKVLGVVFAGAVIAFITRLGQLGILPMNLVVSLGVLLGLLVSVTVMLTWSGFGKGRMITGVAISLVMTILLSVGASYLQKTIDTLKNITNANSETVHMGIYVRAEDAEHYSETATTYQYGILESLDRSSTDEVLRQMEEELGKAVSYQQYSSLPQLVQGLLDGQVDAIILNAAYLDVLKEMDGFKDISNRIVEVELNHVEIDPPQPAQTTQSQQGEQPPKDESSAPFTIYISGIDTRGSANVRSRSDVNILATVNPQSRQILLVSTPRDYYVPLSISNGVPDKLTHAGIYGIEVSQDTIGMLYDMNVDYYVRVNFSGFVEIVDALGGVTVHSDYAFSVRKDGQYYYFQKGDNYLEGKAALVFCRERDSFITGDNQRGKNQMAFIQGMVSKMLSPAILSNYTNLLEAIEDSMITSMPMEKITDLIARQLQGGGSWNVVSYSVTGTDASRIPYSLSQYVYVMLPDETMVNRAKEMIQDVYEGKVVTP